MKSNSIIGRGWSFPIKINSKGGLDWSSGQDRTQAAIWIILSTSPGERLMLPTFGAGIQNYAFQANSQVVCAQLQTAVQKSLTQWEPRIQVVSVQATPSTEQDSLVLISIDYQIRNVNELYNMVYPFFLTEGTL